jgi:hypothetical protein
MKTSIRPTIKNVVRRALAESRRYYGHAQFDSITLITWTKDREGFSANDAIKYKINPVDVLDAAVGRWNTVKATYFPKMRVCDVSYALYKDSGSGEIRLDFEANGLILFSFLASE